MNPKRFKNTRFLRSFGAISVCLIAILGLNPSVNAATWYVDGSVAACDNEGDTWGTAFKYLQDALNNFQLVAGDQIWVKAGEYFVDQSCANEVGTGDRDETFQLVKGVFLLGGFNGTESFASERDSVLNITILRGILADVDPAPPCGPPGGPSCFEPHPGVGCENSRCCQAVCAEDPSCCLTEWDDQCVAKALDICGDAYHVVTAGSEIDDPLSTMIDGFTIRDGTATIALNDRDHGGGMLIRGEPSVVRCTFKQNTATARGGGMSINGEFKQPSIINCIFEDNPGDQPWTPPIGGGLAVSQGDPILTNCLFVANASTGNGGAIFTGVGTCQGQGPPGGCGRITLINCTLVSNTADANNSGSGLGGGLYAGGTATIFDVDSCIFWDNSPDQIDAVGLEESHVDFTDVQGGSPVPGTGNIDVIPLFVGTPDNLRLTIESQCIDAGNPEESIIPCDFFDLDIDGFACLFPDDEATPDLDLVNRVLDGKNDGTAIVDMGSYEFRHPFVCSCPDICPADLDGSCAVDVKDLLVLLGAWGPNPGHPADFDGSGAIDVKDLLFLLGDWGRCPCGAGPGPLSIPEEMENAGLTMDDWDAFQGVMTNPESSQEDKDNYDCWMRHYLNHCTGMACTTPNCPGDAPFGHHE